MPGAVDFDFGMLPPEVNSTLMYAGPGPQSLAAAAAAWADLARELESVAGACAGVLSGLTSSDWQGPAAASMAAAAAPYTTWMRSTASHADQAADHATAAVNAYENAYAATVPPAVVAANRAQLASLTATNMLGQNSAAIAATEASYAKMWAQDAAAMYGYAAQSAPAATLTPLSTPPTTTTDTGLAQQAAATTHATAATAGNTQASLSQLLSSLPTTLNALATGSTSGFNSSSLLNALGLNILAPGSGTSTTGLAGLINLMSGTVPTPLTNAMNSSFISNEFFAGYVMYPGLFMNNIGDMTALATLVGRAVGPAMAAPGLALDPITSQSITPTLGGLGTLVGQHALDGEVSAGVGKATLVGALSAPRSWTTAAQPGAIHLAAAASSRPTSMPGVGIGPIGFPGTPTPGAASRNNHSVPRYGFRLTVLPPAPTGDATTPKE